MTAPDAQPGLPEPEPVPLSLAPLSLTELRRYARPLLVPEWAEAGAQERLRAASVLVVGAGGLGGPVVLALAGSGVGRVVVADGDTVALSNLHRQTHFGTPDLGRPKAEATAARAQAINPHVQLETRGFLTPETAPDLLRGVDLAVDATDNFAARYALADACQAAGVGCVWGAASGTSGMVSVFGFRPGVGRPGQTEPAARPGDWLGLRDVFPDPVGAESCAEAGVLGPLPGLVAQLMALEVLKVLSGVGEPLWGQLWTFEALSGRSRILRLGQPVSTSG